MPKPDVLVITSGINALGVEAIADILAEVKTFKDSNPDNGPWAEHDSRSFTYDGPNALQ